MKKSMKCMAFALSLLLVLSIFPIVTATAEEATFTQKTFTPDQTEVEIGGQTYKIIRTVQQLLSVNENAETEGYKNMILANDLDFDGAVMSSAFIAIVNTVFDGNGYAMYNFSLNSSGNTSIFSTKDNATITIKNITIGLPNKYITSTCTAQGKSNGILLGTPGGITSILVDNVKVYANSTNDKANCGLLIGRLIWGSITIRNTKAYGSITNAQSKPCGGFIGIFDTKGQGDVLIENCESHITVSNPSGDTAAVIGKINTTTLDIANSFVIKNFVNYGNVTGANLGGVIGSANDGKSSITVENYLNIGQLSSGGNRCASIIGYSVDGTYSFKNCANFGSISGAKTTAGLIAKVSTGMSLSNCGSFANVTSTAKLNVNALLTEMPATAIPSKLENLYYTPISEEVAAETFTSDYTRTSKTLEEGIAWANELFKNIFDPIILNSDGNGVASATPEFVAIQQSAIQENKMNIRLASIIGDTLRYSEIGYKIKVNNNETTVKGTTVYRKLLANEGGVTEEITAQALGGSYIFALIIKNIPTNETVTLEITPYAIGIDKTVYNGENFVVTFVNGVCTSY